MKERKVKYSFAEWCKDNHHPDWLDRWDYELNDVSPEEVSYRTSKSYWFLCDRKIHKSEKNYIYNITTGQCSVSCRRCRSFGQYLLDVFGESAIDKYWSNKNKSDPFDIFRGTDSVKVWIKCENINHPDYQITPSNFYFGKRCPVCANAVVYEHINSIYATDRDVVKFFYNLDDTKKYTRNSHKEVEFRCPDCGYVYPRMIYEAFRSHFNCPQCGQTYSFPNKYVLAFLRQLQAIHNFKFKTEKTFKWTKDNKLNSNKFYDFFIEDHEIIIEVNGSQHTNEEFGKIGGRTLAAEIANDVFKKEIALSNGILADKYVVIDAEKSDLEYIKNSILKSPLSQFLPFSEDDIDWTMCSELAIKGLAKQCSELWNSGLRCAEFIAQKLNISEPTAVKYLRAGKSLGMCDFIRSDLIYLSRMQPLICIDNNYVFGSPIQCSKKSKDCFGHYITTKNLYSVLNGTQKTTNGLRFKSITKEEFLELKFKQPNTTFGEVYFYDINHPIG